MDYKKIYYYLAALVGLFITVSATGQLLSQLINGLTQFSWTPDGQLRFFLYPLLTFVPLIVVGAFTWRWHLKKAEAASIAVDSVKVFYLYLVAAISLLSALFIMFFSFVSLFPLLVGFSGTQSLFFWQSIYIMAVPFVLFIGVWYWHLSKANKLTK